MVKEFCKQYKNHKFEVISPCISKRVEFKKAGVGDFNITFTAIGQYLEERGTSLKHYDEVKFDSLIPERGILFSTPGGLKATIAREAPEILDQVRKIEGPDIIYKFLDEFPATLEKGCQPLVNDCLNCKKGSQSSN